mgnify:FL=1
MDVEQSKGRIERQYGYREELMPRAVYNFTILENLVNKDGEYEEKSSTQLSKKLKGLIADNSLLERYPADEKKISDRPRWQVRFSTALRQLKNEHYIEQNRESGLIHQEVTTSLRDIYSLTEEGKSLVSDYKLFIDSNHCYIARRADDISPPAQLLQQELPFVLRSLQGQKSKLGAYANSSGYAY